MQRIFCCLTFTALFFSPELFSNQFPAKKKGFIPNAGQWDQHVKYRMSLPNGAAFLENDGFTYVLYDGEALKYLHEHHETETTTAPESQMIGHHAIKMKLLNCIQGIIPVSENPGTTLYNYYKGNEKEKWASGLHEYQQVRYPGIYPGTELLVYLNESGIKYDYILKPGADPQAIRMKYDGADEVSIQNNTLTIRTSQGTLTEQAPYAYQLIDGVKTEVQCSFFQNEDGSIGFVTGERNSEVDLVIDPQIIFATYSGSFDDNWGYTATYDNAGNGYSGGIVFGANYPVTTGAYQEIFGGGTIDIGILKYNPTGTDALYVTFLGGSDVEFPHSLIVNEYDELLIFGTTGSTDFPVTANAYSTVFAGGVAINFDGINAFNGLDIFVARLSSDGSTLLASTYVGGSGNDGLNSSQLLTYNYADEIRGSLWVDKDNNIYIGTSTESQDFPTGANVIQPSYGGGAQDGVILKLNGNLSILEWATYLGGTGDDGIYYLTVDGDQNVVVTGGTMSDNFAVTPGAYDVTYGGNFQNDGFVSKIDSSGQILIASSYIGTAVYDQTYIVGTDKTNHVFLFGQSATTDGSFLFNAGVGVAQGNNFIMKLEPDLSAAIWSTTFGNEDQGSPEIVPTALLVDVCSQIYAVGWGGALGPPGSTTNGLIATADAYRGTTSGDDFYMYVIDNQAQQLEYATFIGGTSSLNHVDGGTSRFDRKGVVYQSMCGGCGGQSDLATTPNAFSATNNSFNCNNALFKFDFQTPITVAAFASASAPAGCSPYLANFINTSINAAEYHWFVDGVEIDTTYNFSYSFPTSGVFEVTLIATNDTTCNVSDTTSLTITTIGNTQIVMPEITPCIGTELTLGPEGFDEPYYTFQWSPETGLSNPNSSSPIITVTSQELEYVLIISNGTCSDTVITTINPRENTLEILPTLSVCILDTVAIGGTTPAEPGSLYDWTPGNDLNDSTVYNPDLYALSTNIYTLVIRTPFGCVDTVRRQVDVTFGSFNAGPDNEACEGAPVSIGLLDNSGNYTYHWSPSNVVSDSLSSITTAIVATTTEFYLIRYPVGSTAECPAIDTLVVTVRSANRDTLPTLEVCAFDSVLIGPAQSTSPGAVYSWTPANVLSNAALFNPTAYADSSRDFVAIITLENGCVDTLDRRVDIKFDPFNAGADVNACSGDPAEIGIPDNSGNYSYTWNPSGPLTNPVSGSPVATVFEDTRFYLLRTPVGNTAGCPGIDSLDVIIVLKPQAAFALDSFANCQGLSFIFTGLSLGATSSQWRFSDGQTSTEIDPTFVFAYEGLITGQLIAENGACRDTVSFGKLIGEISNYYIENNSNVFSPNGDSFNECFSPALQLTAPPHDKDFLECTDIIIYDRWGLNIYDSTEDGVVSCWSGKSRNGNEMPEGVYFYRYIQGENERAGVVHLKRGN